MRTVIRAAGLLLLILSICFVYSCKKEKPLPPSITTTPVTAISYTTAVSGGNVTDEGTSPLLSMGICWSTSPGATIEDNKTTQNGAMGGFVSNIEQLSQNTKYYLRAYATSNAGTGYGNEVSFTTSAIEPPVLITLTVTSITDSSSISGGNITSDNGGPIIERGVCWGTGSNPTITNSKTSDGAGDGAFSSNITGLSDTTTYHVRAYATNSAGTSYGQDLEFVTLLNPLKVGLMAHYPLDGNANDVSGNNANGIITNAELTTNRNNIQGKALSFSGTNSFITLGSNFDYPLRTINVWFYANIIDMTERHIYISDSPLLLYGFTQIKVQELNGIKQIRSSAGIPGGIAEGNTAIMVNKWYMITLVVDEFKTKHYLNGDLIGIFDNGLARSNNGDTSSLLGTSRVHDRSLVGKIDDVRIYNRALSAAEIKRLFDY